MYPIEFQLEIQPGQMSLAQLRQVARRRVKVSLAQDALPGIHQSQQLVDQVIAEDRTVYGLSLIHI